MNIIAPKSLAFGSIGLEVKALQTALNRNGANLLVDGSYGSVTEAAVRAYQLKVGLVADGVAGKKTLATLTAGQPNPKYLTQLDLVSAAAMLEVSVASIMAVNEIESRGSGFLPDGRTVILFERHIFYRELKKAGLDADALAEKNPAICNATIGGYAGGSAEYTRLALAKNIHAPSALAACSYGAFQIMGFHWQLLGYASVEDFAEKMQASEKNQLTAFCQFIIADPALHKALKKQQWKEFAKAYNGPDYARNLYDVKLARAYEKHAEAFVVAEAETTTETVAEASEEATA